MLILFFFGWDTKSQKIDFEYTEKGVLNHEELASLYNEATVGLLFSMTNYSLLPQEMMACGLPVVEFNGGNTRAVFSDGENILLADPNPYAIADAVIDLLQNEEKRKDIASGGQEWVKQFSWEDSGSIVETALYEL
jgi:glycosyltransferase involved in cell wall biosynthesis